jgi:hypothetical protein
VHVVMGTGEADVVLQVRALRDKGRLVTIEAAMNARASNLGLGEGMEHREARTDRLICAGE